jgi:hypothetical protein
MKEKPEKKPREKKGTGISILNGIIALLMSVLTFIGITASFHLTIMDRLALDTAKDTVIGKLIIAMGNSYFLIAIAAVLVALIALVIVLNMRRLRKAIRCFGFSAFFTSLFCFMGAVLDVPLIKRLPAGLDKALAYTAKAYRSVLLFGGFGFLVLAAVLFAVFMSIDILRGEKNEKDVH